jgi:magnesium transporter
MAENTAMNAEVNCEVARYSEAACLHRGHLTPDEALALCDLKSGAGVLWLNVEGVANSNIVKSVGQHFGMHPLMVEDVLHTRQRPKLESYDGQLYLVARMLEYDDEQHEIMVEQISFVLGRKWIVLFQEKPGDVFDAVRHRIDASGTRLRTQDADMLLYALLDALVDSYFAVLERVGERIEAVEEDLMEHSNQEMLATIHAIRKQLLTLRRTIWPLRDAVSALQHDESSLIAAETTVYLRDIYDHTFRLIDALETHRETIASVYDLYMMSVSNRMNSVMKVLTIISTIFIPLSFVTGIFGMNFRHMPELQKVWGYPAALALMLVIAGVMILFFKRKAWI